mgnify:CR=1 FL=1
MKRANLPTGLALAALIVSAVALSPSARQAAKPAVENDATQERLDRYLRKSMNRDFACSVLVARNDQVILRAGYGWLDDAGTVPATEKTLYNIASITKSFTAIATLQLLERGLARLDDPLSRFFPRAPDDKARITVEQLLVHASGLGQNYAADGIGDRNRAVAAILNDSLKFKPGTDFSYSNENYELLAAVTEVATGQPFERFVRERVLEPAGMTDTLFWDETRDHHHPRIAPFTRPLNATQRLRNWGFIGSGGIFSNVVDLHRWFAAVEGGRLLTPESREAMWTPRRQLSDTSVALGWFVSKAPDGTPEIWTRGTEDFGHNAVLRWFPGRRLLVIVQTNSGEGGDRNITGNRYIGDALVKMLFEDPYR